MATSPQLGTQAYTQSLVQKAGQLGIPGYSSASPSQVSTAVAKSINPANVGGNPKDDVGYQPVAQPGKNIDGTPLNPAGQTATTPAVDTSQPTPQSVTQNTGVNNPATGNTQATTPSGIQGQPDLIGNQSQQAGQAIDQLKQKYGQALTDLNNSKVAPPADQGAANAGITTALNSQPQNNQPQYDPTKVDAKLQDDQVHQQYVNDYTASQSSQAQNESLLKTYKDLSAQLGIESLNTELMNMKKVINGTEDDIRNEITKSGGFATNSQVLALTDARNKVITQNYNDLLAVRDNAVKNLTTMMDLTEKDRAYATQQIDKQLQFDQKQIEYADQSLTKAQDAYKTMATSEGWGAVYKAALATGDPTAIARINSTMGNGFDIATMAKNDTTGQMKQLELKQKQLDIQKTQQELNDASGLPNPTKAGQLGYSDTGVKYNTQNAATEVKNMIQQQGWTGTRGLLAPSSYNYLKSWWVGSAKLSSSDFDSMFGGMKDPSLATKHAYN